MSLINVEILSVSKRVLHVLLLLMLLGAENTWAETETYTFSTSAPTYTDDDGEYKISFYHNPHSSSLIGLYETKDGGAQVLLTLTQRPSISLLTNIAGGWKNRCNK